MLQIARRLLNQRKDEIVPLFLQNDPYLIILSAYPAYYREAVERFNSGGVNLRVLKKFDKPSESGKKYDASTGMRIRLREEALGYWTAPLPLLQNSNGLVDFHLDLSSTFNRQESCVLLFKQYGSSVGNISLSIHQHHIDVSKKRIAKGDSRTNPDNAEEQTTSEPLDLPAPECVLDITFGEFVLMQRYLVAAVPRIFGWDSPTNASAA